MTSLKSSIQLSFPKTRRLYIFSEAMGEIEEVIEEISTEGDPGLKIAFNTSYLLDITKLLNSESETMDINLSGSLGPAMIKIPIKTIISISWYL